jgi:hypothetical protein
MENYFSSLPVFTYFVILVVNILIAVGTDYFLKTHQGTHAQIISIFLILLLIGFVLFFLIAFFQCGKFAPALCFFVSAICLIIVSVTRYYWFEKEKERRRSTSHSTC